MQGERVKAFRFLLLFQNRKIINSFKILVFLNSSKTLKEILLKTYGTTAGWYKLRSQSLGALDAALRGSYYRIRDLLKDVYCNNYYKFLHNKSKNVEEYTPPSVTFDFAEASRKHVWKSDKRYKIEYKNHKIKIAGLNIASWLLDIFFISTLF